MEPRASRRPLPPAEQRLRLLAQLAAVDAALADHAAGAAPGRVPPDRRAGLGALYHRLAAKLDGLDGLYGTPEERAAA